MSAHALIAPRADVERGGIECTGDGGAASGGTGASIAPGGVAVVRQGRHPTMPLRRQTLKKQGGRYAVIQSDCPYHGPSR
jgi:hypothetical protein